MSIYGGLVPLGSDPTTKNPAVVLPIPNSTLNIVYIFLLIIAYLCQKRNLYNKILQQSDHLLCYEHRRTACRRYYDKALFFERQ